MADLGFGFLRLPLLRDGSIDYPALSEMVDAFMANGGYRFDTAYMYHDGESEVAFGKAVAQRYPRERFHLTSKLPGYNYNTREECYAAFREQLEKCCVDYFDIYMLHWMTESRYAHAEAYDQFGFLRELKAAGKAKKIGFSFHDTAPLLDKILTRHPEVDCVLIQINYLDWDSEGVQSRRCYEVARKHGKEIIVMEPVKGGTLVNIPEDAAQLIHSIAPGKSPASQAIRFVRSLEGISTVLSGMSTPEQMADNLSPFQPMTQEEMDVMLRAGQLIRSQAAIGCSGCGYCLKHCPMELPIPTILKLYNEFKFYPRHKWKIDPAYGQLHRKASDCIGCGSCEANCPQHLAIADHMKSVVKALEA